MPPPNKVTDIANKAKPVAAAKSPAAEHARLVPAVIPPIPPTPPDPPRPKRRLWLWMACGGLALALAILGYLQPWKTAVTEVAVETVTAAPATRVLAVNGRISGVRSVDIRPQVSGTLVSISVTEGAVVSIGETVALIDPSSQQAAVRQAMAGLDAALVAEDAAQANLSRTQALGNNAARVVLDSAIRAEQTAAQEVARLSALLDQARIQLQKFTIRAPLSGTVLEVAADPGQSVDPAVILMTIADMTRLLVETDVDESYATHIRTGQPAALQLSGEAAVRAGHVSFVSQRVDASTGGLAVRLTPDVALVAPIGLTVTANITVDDRADAITVPRAALITAAEGDAVFVLQDGTARQRAVQVIDWPAARLIVTKGLSVGDIVLADATGIADGQTVSAAP
jgi:RND family efflux transporter MFP subunit